MKTIIDGEEKEMCTVCGSTASRNQNDECVDCRSSRLTEYAVSIPGFGDALDAIDNWKLNPRR